MATDQKLLLTSIPHMHTPRSTSFAMVAVTVALLPVLGTAVYIFGVSVLALTAATCAGALGAEWISLHLRQRRWTKEASALVTGLILALTLPPGLPLWMGFVGGAIAIVLGKQVFGGTGVNPFNPAAVGRVLLLVAFPAHMTTWTAPLDGVSGATPLVVGGGDAVALTLGTVGGSLGETSVVAILLGGIALLVLRLADWRLPAATIAGTAAAAWVLGGDPLFHVLSGGLLFAAFFMATDWATTPLTRRGRIAFGIGLGFLTVAIRLWGAYPEGVSFAILLMNAVTPLINRAELYSREMRRRRAHVRPTG